MDEVEAGVVEIGTGLGRTSRVGSTVLAFAALLALAALGVSCTDAERAATPSPSETATVIAASPTPAQSLTPDAQSTGLPTAARSTLWLIEVASGRTSVLYEGNGQASARFDPDGQSISALIHLPQDAGWSSQRFDLDGRVVEEYDDRLLMFVSPDGRSRYYTSVAADDLPNGRFVLEHDGEPVVLNAPAGTFAAGFSPSGDRLLAGSGALENSTSVLLTYHIYDVETGGILGTVEARAREGTDGGESPRWSPSGRHIAASGTDGLYVHDTATGEAVHLGRGSARWSPAEDAILALDEERNLDLVRFPEAERTRLAAAIGPHHPYFGGVGEYAYWYDHTAVATTVVSASTGTIVATWSGVGAAYAGVDLLVATPDGPGAPLAVAEPRCQGIDLHHPALPDGATCLEDGAAPRWSPDGRLLAYALDDEILILDLSTGNERGVAQGIAPGSAVDGSLVRWSPDGTHLLVQWPSGGVGWSEG